MLFWQNSRLKSTQALMRQNDQDRIFIAATVRMTMSSFWVKMAATELIYAEDPVEKVVEMAQSDPEALRVLLQSSMFLLNTLHEKQEIEAEIERRSAAN